MCIRDRLRTVKKAMDADVAALSIVNTVGSLIARTTKLGVYLNAGRENAVASTKAFTTQVTVMALITCWFHQLRASDPESPVPDKSPKFAELMDEVQRLPISFGMGLRLQDQCKALASKLKDKDHLFILGKGYAAATKTTLSSVVLRYLPSPISRSKRGLFGSFLDR